MAGTVAPPDSSEERRPERVARLQGLTVLCRRDTHVHMSETQEQLTWNPKDAPLLGLDEFESDALATPSQDHQRLVKLMQLGRAALSEFIGTFFLVSVIELTAGQSEPLAPLAIGGILTVMVFAFGHISGAHFNPAVSLGVYIRGDLPIVALPIYVVAQMLGAISGALVQLLVLQDISTACTSSGKCGAGYPSPNPSASWIGALTSETLWTFALVSVVLNVATSKATAKNDFFGLAIGMTVMSAAIAAGNVSGGVFNPAVGTVLPLVHQDYESIWLYWVGPLTGGALAGLVFRIYADPDEFAKCCRSGSSRCVCTR